MHAEQLREQIAAHELERKRLAAIKLAEGNELRQRQSREKAMVEVGCACIGNDCRLDVYLGALPMAPQLTFTLRSKMRVTLRGLDSMQSESSQAFNQLYSSWAQLTAMLLCRQPSSASWLRWRPTASLRSTGQSWHATGR